MLKLNKYEQEQYSQLILKIRADLPFKKQQASVYIPLVRGRVCVALNQAIDRREISDIRVDRSEKKLTDISTYKQFINLGAPVTAAPFSYIPPRAARLFFYSHSKEATQNVRKFRLENRP